jgi:hypothetical protein
MDVMKRMVFSLLTLALVAGGGRLALGQANAVQMHIGHVADSFPQTPDKQGLLPAALAEAKIAAQHATLGSKNPEDLAGMKLHAGHVLHALDPSVEAKGPGLGYGVKKAAQGAAVHIENAAKADGASANVKTHSAHIAGAANSAAARADEAIALAQKVRAATTAEEAAAAMKDLVAAVDGITAGIDANKDGRVYWAAPVGGLNQAQQHLDLLKKGEAQ